MDHGLFPGRRGAPEGKLDRDRRAPAGRTLEPDRAAVLQEDVAGDRQPQSRALARSLRREEGLEDVLQIRRRDAAPVVRDLKLDPVFGGPAAPNVDRAAGRDGVERIAEHDRKQGFEQVAIREDASAVGLRPGRGETRAFFAWTDGARKLTIDSRMRAASSGCFCAPGRRENSRSRRTNCWQKRIPLSSCARSDRQEPWCSRSRIICTRRSMAASGVFR